MKQWLKNAMLLAWLWIIPCLYVPVNAQITQFTPNSISGCLLWLDATDTQTSLAGGATMPGHARWTAMIAQAQTLLSQASDEMQSYHDDRSEQWQDGPRAEVLLA